MSSGSETQSLDPLSGADEGLQDVEKWSTGDFALISSDKFRFKVLSHDLFHASAVLRDAPAEGEKLIHFTDDKIETKAVLESFLTLATTGYLPDVEVASPNVLGVKIDTAKLNLLRFLQKYDCTPTLVALAHQITLLLCHKRITPTDAYCFGAIADDVQICATAVALAGPDRADQISMVSITAEVWRLSKTKYMYALKKAENMQHGLAVTFMEAFTQWKWELSNQKDVFSDNFYVRAPAEPDEAEWFYDEATPPEWE